MDTINDTPKSRKNKHLNEYERGQIQMLVKEGLSPYAIAKKLGRVANTIRNELNRGTVQQIKADKLVMVYYPDVGQLAYERNRKNCGPKFKYLKCSEFIEYATDLFVNKKHSLDAICGTAREKGLFTKEQMVCTKTLYNYVDARLLTIRNIDLPLKLRRRPKKHRIRKHKRQLGTCISERPAAINERKEFGHWEIDTVIGSKSKSDAVLLTMTERMTRKELIMKIPNKTSKAVQEALIGIIRETGTTFSEVFKSITADNGSEFSELPELEVTTNTKVYFSHPYTSSERGTNERHNGLIRRFIPKGKQINQYSIEAIAKVQEWCNTLPRKILNYKTPDEAFEANIKDILSS